MLAALPRWQTKENGVLSNEVLDMLCCPENRSRLTPASDKLVRDINAAITGGRLLNRAGKTVEHAIDGGLVRADRAWIYPIVDQIPILIQGDAISMSQFDHA
jgi:uncharacterized protein